jgi:hypothetical protein
VGRSMERVHGPEAGAGVGGSQRWVGVWAGQRWRQWPGEGGRWSGEGGGRGTMGGRRLGRDGWGTAGGQRPGTAARVEAGVQRAGEQRPGRDSDGLAGHAGMDLSQLRERGVGARGHFF